MAFLSQKMCCLLLFGRKAIDQICGICFGVLFFNSYIIIYIIIFLCWLLVQSIGKIIFVELTSVK